MTNHTRRQLIEAWESMDWLKSLINPDAGTIQGDKDRLLHAIQDLAEALPPQPRPTMAETEWDDDLHYLAEAESGIGVKVIMLSEHEDSIMCIQPPNAGGISIGFLRSDLTPTGRRYTLTEVQE